MTTKAYGRNAILLGAFETTPGTAPADGYTQLPFVSSTVGGERPIIAADIRNGSREPVAGLPGHLEVGGDVVAPLCVNASGFWLKSIFGAPTTTGTGPFTHVFESGGSPAPVTLEIGHPDVGKFRRNTFLVADKLTLARKGDDAAQLNMTVSFRGADEAVAGTTIDSAPASLPLKRVPVLTGTVTLDGAPLGSVVGFSLDYTNAVSVVREFGRIDVAEGDATLAGTVTIRFDGTTLESVAGTGSPVTITFTQQIDASNCIAFAVHGTLNSPKAAIEGPAGIEKTFSLSGCRQADGGPMLTATLVNTVASY
ncbi:phage tail tube protein [Roseomonas genomospecies 6]|uniref:Phage tail protein n=1 Tax=Roseomonas genomospecies 6 TaxID=214106 RepID=A0A9W7NFQ0_9PROT|nr:phage tail tube protein [Roseomonas genomospecies 6]KAA0677783.1 hypothetical protein DS843_21935 [Roseomonas genomospecies 6]